jgi:hypothetical protein
MLLLYFAILFFTLPFLVSFLVKKIKIPEFVTYPAIIIVEVSIPIILAANSLLPVEGFLLAVSVLFLTPLLVLTQYLANILFFETGEHINNQRASGSDINDVPGA